MAIILNFSAAAMKLLRSNEREVRRWLYERANKVAEYRGAKIIEEVDAFAAIVSLGDFAAQIAADAETMKKGE